MRYILTYGYCYCCFFFLPLFFVFCAYIDVHENDDDVEVKEMEFNEVFMRY
jgi:hypothetical protein